MNNKYNSNESVDHDEDNKINDSNNNDYVLIMSRTRFRVNIHSIVA